MSKLKSRLRWLFPSYAVEQLARVPFWTLIVLVIATSVIISGYNIEMTQIKTIGDDTSPSMELAHKIKSSMVRLGADVVDELSAKPGQNYDSVKDYRKQLQQVERSIVDASHNITYVDNALGLHHEPEGELGVMRRLEADMDRFIELTTEARIYHERGDAATLAANRELVDLVMGQIVNDCDALANVNRSYYEHALSQRGSVEKMTIATTVAAGVLLLLVLLYTQGFIITRKFRVGISLMFVLATATTTAGCGFFAWQFIQSDESLRSAAIDAIPSVDALQDMRAMLQTGIMLQHVVLQDRPYAAQNSSLLETYTARAGEFGANQTAATIMAEVRRHYSFDGGVPTKKSDIPASVVTGSLRDALNNLTFKGEYEAAGHVLQYLEQWRSIWTQVQALEATGQHDKAVALLSGQEAGQGNNVFALLNDSQGDEHVSADNALGSWITINHDAQLQAIAEARRHLKDVEIGVPAMALIIELLVFFGTFSLRRSVSPEVVARRRGLIVEA